MRKVSLVQKQTKLTMNVLLDCEYQDSVCEFKIKQEFCSNSDDSDEVLKELLYFIKKGSFIPLKKKSFNIEMDVNMDIYDIYFESFWNDTETSIFYDKLMNHLNEILPYDIVCSDEIRKNLNQEQIENLGDGGWSIFVKNNPEYALKNS
jgi:hypothetical protein